MSRVGTGRISKREQASARTNFKRISGALLVRATSPDLCNGMLKVWPLFPTPYEGVGYMTAEPSRMH